MEDEDDRLEAISAIAETPPIRPILVSTDEGTGDPIDDSIRRSMLGEEARAALIDHAALLSSVASHIDPSDETLGDLTSRINRGESLIQREDIVYVSPDKERAQGLEDLQEAKDLIGN